MKTSVLRAACVHPRALRIAAKFHDDEQTTEMLKLKNNIGHTVVDGQQTGIRHNNWKPDF